MADTFCKQFGPGSGLTKCQAQSGSNQFDTLMIFLIDFFQNKIKFKKKKNENYPAWKELYKTQWPLFQIDR